jgi:F0F1-type ATP synthase assembly protein I
MLCMQVNILYYFLWAEVFANNFTPTSTISTAVFVSGVEATLAVVVTASVLANKLSQLSLFVLTIVESFFFALNWGVCSWGVKAITGGGAATVWLFGFVFAGCVKRMRFPGIGREATSSKYFTKTLQVVALIIVVILWPTLNQLMAALDTSAPFLLSTATLSQNAYLQTWLCLFSAVVTTLGLRVMGERIDLDKIISSIVNVPRLRYRLGC